MLIFEFCFLVLLLLLFFFFEKASSTPRKEADKKGKNTH